MGRRFSLLHLLNPIAPITPNTASSTAGLFASLHFGRSVSGIFFGSRINIVTSG